MVAEFDDLIEPVAGDVMARPQYRGSVIVFCPRVDTYLESHREPGTSPKAGRFPSHIATRAVKPPSRTPAF
jgi:hypothetical protein